MGSTALLRHRLQAQFINIDPHLVNGLAPAAALSRYIARLALGAKPDT